MSANLEDIFDGIDISDLVAGNRYARQLDNQATGYDKKQFFHWRTHLVNIYLSSIEWEGLPGGIDPRAVEYVLMVYGCGAMFEEDGGHLFGAASMADNLNINYNPNRVLITSPAGNSWQRHAQAWVLDGEVMMADCALCWDTMRRAPALADINYYAKRLARIDRVADVNVEAQLTPYIIAGSDAQEANSRALIERLRSHAQYITYNNQLNDAADVIQVLNTQAPFVADQLYKVKRELINEFLTSIGVDNDPNADKREARPVAEIVQNNEQVMLARRARLEPRRQFCERVREVFGLDISVKWSPVHEMAESNAWIVNREIADTDPSGGNPIV